MAGATGDSDMRPEEMASRLEAMKVESRELLVSAPNGLSGARGAVLAHALRQLADWSQLAREQLEAPAADDAEGSTGRPVYD